MIAKCQCQYCDSGIEFDSEQAGEIVSCPHCGLETSLFVRVEKTQEIKVLPVMVAKKPLISTGAKWWMIGGFMFVFLELLAGAFENSGLPSIYNLFMGLFGYAMFSLFVFIYFLPYYFACKRHKKNKDAIFILNLFLGWTFVGWVVAAVWAHTKD